jgi:RNA polymerase sigma-70 factor (ECF subfamily)
LGQTAELLLSDDQTDMWIKSAQQGDVSSFEKLYLGYHKRIYLFAKRMTGSVSAAEEVVQETFIKTWQNLTSFRAESQFYTWLRTIATRIVIDRLRVKNAKVWQQMSDYDEVHASLNSNAGQQRDLEKLIGLLPEGARSVFVLHDIEGYKHAEIAQLSGIAAGTSKAQLFRARKLLRENLTRD